MTRRFNAADHVNWNSQAGRVSGTIVITWLCIERRR
jgi:hypothetical protein